MVLRFCQGLGGGVAAALGGILTFQQLSFLPAVEWAVLIPVLLVLGWRWPLLRLSAWFAGGMCWTLLHAHFLLSSALSPELEGLDLRAEGVIISVPERSDRAVHFEFEIERLWRGDELLQAPQRVRLSWYEGAPALAVGERWELLLRLKRPHGFANPGSFDYEAWLYRKGVRATGYVRENTHNRRLDADTRAYPLQRLRQRLGEAMISALPERELRGVVVALAIGDYQYIAREQWGVFRNTGTTHLVAISGMHVAMIAALCFVAVRWSWAHLGSYWGLPLRWPAPHVGAIAAIVGAAAYTALAGFSVPTQRALVMVIAAMLALLCGRGRALARTFGIALLCVLLYDPLAVMDAGFWLSFGAVAIILLGMGGRVGVPQGWRGWWWRLGRLHILITIGLAPGLLLLFQQFSLASPFANFVAVPWISLAVPVVLLGAAFVLLFPMLAEPLLSVSEWWLALLWPWLQWLAGIDGLQWIQHAPSGWMLIAALFGALLTLVPEGFPGRWLGCVFLLPALLAVPPRPAAGALWFTLLDVGQGLSVVLRTQKHTLVYDTGPSYAGLDAGSAVVLPYLREQGVRSIDMLLVSHGDNDHAGGAPAVLGGMRVDRILTSELVLRDQALFDQESMNEASINHASIVDAEACREGMSWQWDDVHFEILHPLSTMTFAKRNEAACVLRVEVGGVGVLLPADIEARAEARLLRSGHDVSAKILVAPHHGSRTSSTAAFVRAVAPSYVLYAVGYRNRWGFPRPDVVARYDQLGAQAYDSSTGGAVDFQISATGEIAPPQTWRRLHRRYWYEG
ncbi:MAG: DNA internalization-related competence protein ComEC/Rec2 [Chromatiales bacterium]|jgi:competence protein ComEC|nr:DNA internalization-related competence protein ComEC/Rec2 [Chromatiales bacterium]